VNKPVFVKASNFSTFFLTSEHDVGIILTKRLAVGEVVANQPIFGRLSCTNSPRLPGWSIRNT